MSSPQSNPLPSTAPKRVALLGAGYIADWHAQALRSVSGVELVAVCDSVQPKAQALAQKFGIPQAYSSLEEMLAIENTGETQLDAVHVLTPPDLHFGPARQILEAGVHVFLEKPMSASAAECDALVDLAAARGLRLGVGHNFLFAEAYERLRNDLRAGVLGRIDDISITWHRALPQALHGPFHSWMLRDPRNILLEVGSHSVAHLFDLLAEARLSQPSGFTVQPSNPMELPTGVPFYRRWQVNALAGRAAVQLRFSFVPAFPEYTLHLRGSLASATVDFERNTYTLDEHYPADPDFENRSILITRAKSLRRQANQTLATYIKSKLKLTRRGNPYGASIARALDAFYSDSALDPRIDGRLGANVIRLCQHLGALANLPNPSPAVQPFAPPHEPIAPKILVLGASGFIGRELLRQLLAAGRPVRALVRSPLNLPEDLRANPNLQLLSGDLASQADILRAMEGISAVLHLARANVKTWADYQTFEIEATRRVALCALQSGIQRFVYTGTIDSYYSGAPSTITESTPLDPKIHRRNLYARAKAESEQILFALHRQQHLPLVILRPGIVIGRGGSPFHWGIGMWWNDSVCQIWGKGNNKLGLVLVEDIASALIAAIDTPGIDGHSFNLVGPPLLTANEYLDALDRAGRFRIQRHATPIARFYLLDMLKWLVKLAVRHPERRLPSWRDWQSRTGQAVFDCTAAQTALNWQPTADRETLIRCGIELPLQEFLS